MSLKELIKSSGKTQQQIADEMGVHQTLISQWSSKKTKISLVDASRLSKIIGVPIEKIADSVAGDRTNKKEG